MQFSLASIRSITLSAIAAGVLVARPVQSRAGDPVGYTVDISGRTAHAADLWPSNGDLDFARGNIGTSIADLDGDLIPDVVCVSPAQGAGSNLSSRKLKGGMVNGSISIASGSRFVATGTFSDGGTRDLTAVVSPGPGQSGPFQLYSWNTTSNQFVVANNIGNAGTIANPFGDVKVGAGCVPCDLDGDGYDSVVCVAQGPVPPVNGSPGSRVVVMSQPKKGGTFQRAFTIDTIGPDVTSGISVASGPLIGDGTSQIALVYTDPVTGIPQLQVERKSISVIFHNDAGEEVSRYPVHLSKSNIVHRDIACRMVMGDLNGDGTDEIVVSGNDGTEPVVSILTLGTFTASDGTIGLSVVNQTPIDLSELAPQFGSDWSQVEFDPSVTAAALTSSLDSPAAGLSGTLLLTTTFVPEPTSLLLFGCVPILVYRSRRC